MVLSLRIGFRSVEALGPMGYHTRDDLAAMLAGHGPVDATWS